MNKFCDCSAYVVVCAGLNSHTQEEALFPLSNDNRACVAMATGCAFYGLCECVCVFASLCLCVCHAHCLPVFIVCFGRGATPDLLPKSFFSHSFYGSSSYETLKIFPSFLSLYFSILLFFNSPSFYPSGFSFPFSPVFKCALVLCVCACVSVSSSLTLKQLWQVGQHQNSVAHCLRLRFVRSLLQLNWTEDWSERVRCEKRSIKKKRGGWERRVLKLAYILHEPPHHTPFFTEWLCTVLGLLILLAERIIFRDSCTGKGF